jgi:pimeloyl-ACP methyl ester carboxylesterase
MHGGHHSAPVRGSALFLWLARRRVLWVVLVLGMLRVLVAGAGEATLAQAGASRGAHRVRIAWKSCGIRLQCARVQVPLDWARPAEGTITLALIRHLATRSDRRLGSLFVNFGGPGVAAVPMVRSGGAFLDTLGEGRFDVIGWDPRGTGASTHVQCFADAGDQTRFWGSDWSVPTTAPASARYVPKTVAFGRRCAARSGRLLAHISTADTARDLDYLRGLVGDPRLTYLGYSYGSFLGQTYASMFPRRVRAMVLDGIVDPVPFTTGVEAQIANSIADTTRVFSKFESLCERAGPARCALAGHGPVLRRMSALLARLRRGPIPAPSAGPRRQLSYGDLLIDLFARLGSPEQWPKLADGLEQAAAGDGSALETEARQAIPGYQSALVSAVALQCADKPPPRHGPQAWPTVIHRLTGISPLSGPVQGWWLWAPCASWPVASASRYAGPWNAPTRTPILVIGTRFDPQTPVANARRVARLLSNAVLLTDDGYGHTSSADPSACVGDKIASYLDELIAPPKGAVCRSDRRPFDPKFGQPLSQRTGR